MLFFGVCHQHSLYLFVVVSQKQSFAKISFVFCEFYKSEIVISIRLFPKLLRQNPLPTLNDFPSFIGKVNFCLARLHSFAIFAAFVKYIMSTCQNKAAEDKSSHSPNYCGSAVSEDYLWPDLNDLIKRMFDCWLLISIYMIFCLLFKMRSQCITLIL